MSCAGPRTRSAVTSWRSSRQRSGPPANQSAAAYHLARWKSPLADFVDLRCGASSRRGRPRRRPPCARSAPRSVHGARPPFFSPPPTRPRNSWRVRRRARPRSTSPWWRPRSCSTFRFRSRGACSPHAAHRSCYPRRLRAWRAEKPRPPTPTPLSASPSCACARGRGRHRRCRTRPTPTTRRACRRAETPRSCRAAAAASKPTRNCRPWRRCRPRTRPR
mmetsp:Transcript_52904/g.172140  ORF Transcript_52904/g.172140 Transcript_52904/m.172140 type:complete len:219 (-) Transcript_52904:978-1634(-)